MRLLRISVTHLDAPQLVHGVNWYLWRPSRGMEFLLMNPGDSLVNIRAAAAEQRRADRRTSARKVMRVQARIRVPGEEAPLDAHTVDLSVGGVSITSSQQLNLGQECSVELGISAPEIAPPPGLRARVRYCGRLRDGQYRIGFEFSSVSIEAAELLVAVLV